MKMKWFVSCTILIFLLIVMMPLAGMTQGNKNLKRLKGYWSGQLQIQSLNLRLVMNVNAGEKDSMIVTFDSPDQGVLDLPTDRASLEEDSLDVSAMPIGAAFGGRVNKTFDTIRGYWKQSGMSFPLTLVRQGMKSSLNRPQEPKPPFPYEREDVTITQTTGGFELSGTLTRPGKTGTYPALILLTGSGPQNRDEELLGHKPFLVIADFMTRLGWAVLRFDDRGTGKSKGDFSTATTYDLATDAEAAFDFLRRQPGIDTTCIGLAGHSEGAILASIVASRRTEVKFVILLAGPGTTGEQILLRQSELISKAEGVEDATLRLTDKLNRDIYSVLRKISDNDKAGRKIRSLLTAYDHARKSETGYQPMPEKVIDAQIKTLTSPWFRCFLTLDPEVILSKIHCPLLALGGSLDLQVPAKENLEAIEKAMIFGGNSSYQVEELPGLNHLFQTATTGSPTEYGSIEETFSPEALGRIFKWLTDIRK